MFLVNSNEKASPYSIELNTVPVAGRVATAGFSSALVGWAGSRDHRLGGIALWHTTLSSSYPRPTRAPASARASNCGSSWSSAKCCPRLRSTASAPVQATYLIILFIYFMHGTHSSMSLETWERYLYRQEWNLNRQWMIWNGHKIPIVCRRRIYSKS